MWRCYVGWSIRSSDRVRPKEHLLPVTLSPSGTRGTEIPGFAMALMKAGAGLGNLLFNMMGDRMKMQL